MSIALYYRINATTPDQATTTTVVNRPLTMLEIDGNFKSIADAFVDTDSAITTINTTLSTKAPINRPTFTGSITIPSCTSTTRPLQPVEGMVVFDRSEKSLITYDGSQWITLTTNAGLDGYVKRTGDILTGKLIGTTAEFSGNIRALPPDSEPGSTTDLVATCGWVESQVLTIVNNRLSGGSGSGDDDSININTGSLNVYRGDVTIERGDLYVGGTIHGDIDLGIL